MELNQSIVSDFTDEKWKALRGETLKEVDDLIDSKIDQLKSNIEEQISKYANATYDADLRANLAALQKEASQAINDMNVDFNAVKTAIDALNQTVANDPNLAALQNSTAQLTGLATALDDRINEVRDKTTSFASSAGKTISSSLMKTMLGAF